MKISDSNVECNEKQKDIMDVFYCQKCNKTMKCDEHHETKQPDGGRCWECCPIVRLFYEYVEVTEKINDLNNQIAVLQSKQGNIEEKVDCFVYGKCEPGHKK